MDATGTTASTFSYAELRGRMKALQAYAEAHMCEIAVADYESFEAAGSLALLPGNVMVYCMRCATCHLYDRQQWHGWLDHQESLMLAAAPVTASGGRSGQGYILKELAQQRRRQLRLEIPFFLWQHPLLPIAKAVIPHAMTVAEYEALVAVPLLIPARAIPNRILLQFHQCVRKVSYSSAERAQAFLNRKTAEGAVWTRDTTQAPYACPHCRNWHVGKAQGESTGHLSDMNHLRNATRSWNTYHRAANTFAKRHGWTDFIA